MKNKLIITTVTAIIAVLFAVLLGNTLLAQSVVISTDTVQVKPVAQDITASGSIHSQQEAVLHFLTTGKVVYLPFKQGDTVYQGQTVAQLDTYALQKQLEAALNTYRSTRDVFDQTQSNSQNNVLQTQQQSSFPGIQADKTNAINDSVKRILDESQGTLDNSVINVELANYALQLSSLTAPFNGTLVAEDITTPNVNVTPVTSFTIADLSQKVFRAQVAASDIDFVSVGSKATVKLDGLKKSFTGSVLTIYPQKQILPNGEQVYNVDIQLNDLFENSAYGQNGSVLISSNDSSHALMIPSWTIVGHNSVWVLDGKKAVLKKIQLGKSHDSMTEITSGLASTDKVIIAPKEVVKMFYTML